MESSKTIENRAMTASRARTIRTAYNTVEMLFMTGFAIGIAHLITNSSTFWLGILPETKETFLIVLAITAAVKSGLLLASVYRTVDFKRTISYLALALAVAAVFCAVYLSLRNLEGYPEDNSYLTILFLALSVIGTVGTDYKRIMRLYVVVAAFVLAVIVTAAICGAITNYVYVKDWHIRSSWGIGYPTDMASYFFYLCVFYWIAFCKKNDLHFLAPGFAALLIAHFIARSDTSTICDIALLITIFLNWLFQNDKLIKLRAIADKAVVWAFPFFTVLMIALMFAYIDGVGIAVRINEIMTGRISLAANAYKEYGLSLFGEPLQQIGAGGGNFANAGYDFVDSTYHLLLLNYGIVTLIMINILWVLMTKKALIIGDRRLALGMALIAFHSVSEHHFIEPNFNVLIAMPVAVLMTKKASQTSIEEKKESKERLAAEKLHIKMILLMVGVLLLLVTAAYTLLPWARTIFTYSGLTDTDIGRRKLFAAIAVLVIAAAAIIYCVYKLAASISRNNGKTKPYAMTLLLFVIISAAFLWKTNNYLEGAYDNRADIVCGDEKAISAIKDAEGKLFVCDYPEFYRRKYGKISTSLFDKEELARYRNISVITDKNLDSPVFFGHGFLYSQISDDHAVYTNDKKAIEAMREEGYVFHGFYPVLSQVDLKNEAQLNGLDYTEGEPLKLTGGTDAITMGPYYDLRSGRYTLRLDLHVDRKEHKAMSEMPDSNHVDIATIEISREWGKEIITKETLTDLDFNEEGNCFAQIVYSIPDSRAVEFKIVPEKGIELSVASITNQKTPEYDVHARYNKKGQKIHEEYFDLNGEPLMLEAGYAGKDMFYDKKGNISKEIYYDRVP